MENSTDLLTSSQHQSEFHYNDYCKPSPALKNQQSSKKYNFFFSGLWIEAHLGKILHGAHPC